MHASRPSVAFLAWSPVGGRSADIAEALGGVAWCHYDDRLRGWKAPLRYLWSSVHQIRWLRRHRPGAVIATNPPIFCGLIAYAYASSARVPFVLDSHPASFGYKQNRQGRWFLPIHRWLAPRTAAVLVTTDEPADVVRRWGGRPVVVHEPPAAIGILPRPPRERPLISFIATFAADEPIREVIEAARRRPDVDVAVTGRLSEAPEHVIRDRPDNVELVGWLGPEEYVDLLVRSTAIISLTTEPTSVMRSAYEAVYAGRPLIATDTPVLRRLFPDAVFTPNRPDAICDAMGTVLEDLPELDAKAAAARARQEVRWSAQLDLLSEVLELEG